VAEGVRGVCYPASDTWMAYHGALPFLPESPWQVVLSTGPNSRSEPGVPAVRRPS